SILASGKVFFNDFQFRTVATICSVIVTPLLYYYIQIIQTTLTNEIEFCKQRSKNMWKEYANIEEMLNVKEQRSWRSPRQTNFDYYSPMSNGETSPYDVLRPYSDPRVMQAHTVYDIQGPYSNLGLPQVQTGVYDIPGPYLEPEIPQTEVYQNSVCCSCKIGEAG
ncbi:unnamed protein product, partial [Brugia timori]|uniref:Col_cuticle_N domain-containing protein n=1 Tax=Brugia timori TaxID=42155 RepID=A0A0R3RBC1_9BILA